jgi:hypothetical protein
MTEIDVITSSYRDDERLMMTRTGRPGTDATDATRLVNVMTKCERNHESM